MTTRPYRASDFPPLDGFPNDSAVPLAPTSQKTGINREELLLLCVFLLLFGENKSSDKTLPLLIGMLLFSK